MIVPKGASEEEERVGTIDFNISGARDGMLTIVINIGGKKKKFKCTALNQDDDIIAKAVKFTIAALKRL
jgi:hypothetical protein